MNTLSYMKNFALVALMAVGLVVPALAEENPPQPMNQGSVTFVMGGVGAHAREALEATAKDYNLRITNATKNSELTGADSIVIKDSTGKQILTIQNSDPLLYAKLPAGTYTIEAVDGDTHKVEKVTISGTKAADIHLVW